MLVRVESVLVCAGAKRGGTAEANPFVLTGWKGFLFGRGGDWVLGDQALWDWEEVDELMRR
jgi:hypothetical protein